MTETEHEPDGDDREDRIAIFKGRTAEQAERDHLAAATENREAHENPDPAIEDPLRAFQREQRIWRKRVKHRGRRRYGLRAWR